MNGIKRNILLNPGPATTTDSVKRAMLVPDICPREAEFCEIVSEIRKDLTKLVNSENDDYTCVLFCGSGTSVMDAVINSVLPEHKKIAIISNGAYGDRMVKIAEVYKIPVVHINFNFGEKIDLKRVEALLDDPEIACTAVVHHETTTGILNPIREIGRICKKYNQVFIVDAISSYAGIPINISENNIDFLLSTSNKCIQGMAGIAFAICKRAEIEKTAEYPKRSFYLNLYDQYKFLEKTGQTQFTPPVQILYALKQAIKEYFEEGAENRYRRYTENWKTLREGLQKLNFQLLHKEEDESHILLTVLEPETKGYDFTKMHDFLYERGFTIYPGKINNLKTFRIANMGAIYPSDIQEFINILEDYCKELF